MLIFYLYVYKTATTTIESRKSDQVIGFFLSINLFCLTLPFREVTLVAAVFK